VQGPEFNHQYYKNRPPNIHDQKRASFHHIIIKMPRLQNKERILKAIREKHQFTYNCKFIRITSDLLTKTLKSRKAWNDICQALKANNCQPRLLYPEKLSFKING
jgi:hypothetical protein